MYIYIYYVYIYYVYIYYVYIYTHIISHVKIISFLEYRSIYPLYMHNNPPIPCSKKPEPRGETRPAHGGVSRSTGG